MEDKYYTLGVMPSYTRDANNAHGLPAIVSIEIQRFGETYEVETGFPCGTIFPELHKPFLAGGMAR